MDRINLDDVLGCYQVIGSRAPLPVHENCSVSQDCLRNTKLSQHRSERPRTPAGLDPAQGRLNHALRRTAPGCATDSRMPFDDTAVAVDEDAVAIFEQGEC